ncbi:MAG: MFS transporter, partial [Micromonosporaceae bacterium]|nr:MFS transporter [Micromonosporaceae bacterium]
METNSQRGRPGPWVILGALVVSLLVVVLDTTVLNVALRVIADPEQGLGASQGELEWMVNSYTLACAGLLFTWGVLGDRWGRRAVLLGGLLLFGLASLASACATGPGQLIAARVVMGVGGAAVIPATLSIISNVFEPAQRPKAIGIWAATVGLATAIGPVVGGWLLEHFWWGSVFLINVPIVAAGLVGILVIVPESRDPRPGGLDLVGVLLSVAGLVSLVYGIVDGGEHGFDRLSALGAIGAGLAILAVFVGWERRVAYPCLDVRLFRSPAFSAAVGVVGLVFLIAMGAMFYVSFYLQTIRGYTPLRTGVMFLPFAAAQLMFAPLSSIAVRRLGARTVCSLGMALAGLSMAGMSTLDKETPVWVINGLFFLMGMGMANLMPPATEVAMAALPRHRAGVGSAVNNTTRQVGGALGVALLGSLISSLYQNRLAPGIAGLPEAVQEAARESIAGAYA